MREKEHQLKLCIKGDYDSRNILKGIIVSGETPQFFKGESSFYYVEDGYLNRISQPCAEILGPIIEMSPYKRVRLEFGRKAFADFYHHVMPMLSEYVEFEDMEPDILDTYVPPKAEFKFYLDAETDVITCDTKVIYGEDRGLFIGERDEESVFAVLERGVNELLTLGEVFCTDRLKRITIRKKTPLSVGVSLESGIMNLDISSEEYSNEELLEILGSYRKRKKYHQLKNGDYLNLEDENIQMLEEMMESLHISSKEFLKGNIKVPDYRALYLDKVLEKNKSIYTERDKHFKSLIKEFKTVSDSDFEVPESLHKNLHVLHQK